MKKLTRDRNECKNRTEHLTTVWENLRILIGKGVENIDKWTQCVIKFTLESMLKVTAYEFGKEDTCAGAFYL